MSARAGRQVLAASLLVAAVGCSCDEPSVHEVRRPEREPEPAPAMDDRGLELPSAQRADLPPAPPSVTIEVSARGFRVSNRALIDTWPAPERDAAHAHAPAGLPDFPVVEVAIPTIDPVPLRVTGLQTALSQAAEADRSRGALGTPSVVSIRAGADVRWERVLRALFASGLSGYGEPWLVVSTPAGERTIRLSGVGTAPSPDARASIAAALAALGRGDPGPTEPAPSIAAPTEPTPGIAPPTTETGARVSLRLLDHGLFVRRGLVDLGGDCRGPAIDASPTFSSVTLDRERLSQCLDALGAIESVELEAGFDLTYASVVMVLESAALRAPVSIAMNVPDDAR